MNNCYVSKNKVKPYRDYFKSLMDKIRPFIKKNGISFTYILVGSAKRNLVIRHHNKGFDCDYQIYITKNSNNLKAIEIKRLFINQINKCKSMEYENCEDSTSAITLKKININEFKIEFSYDIVILKEEQDFLYIIRRNKNDYKYECLPDMTDSYNNFKKIQGKEMWDELRERYYKKKIENLQNNKNLIKKSFQILNEVVNEVLQKYKSN